MWHADNLPHSTLRVDATNLVVLDGEKNEAVGVLLQEGLAGLSSLDTSSSLGNLSDGLLGGRVDGLSGGRDILLADRGEVELLSGGVAHLKVLEGGSSLWKH